MVHLGKLLIIISVAFHLSACKNDNESKLIPLTEEETSSRLLSGQQQEFLFSTYTNAEGQPLSKEEKALLNEGQLYRTYYKNQAGKVVQVRCSPIKGDEHKLFAEIRLTQLLTDNPLKIEQCGFPKTRENIKSVWFVMQHAGHSGLMEVYHPQFQHAAKDDLLDLKTLAKMEDRLLMHHGFPQIYGTQFVSGQRSPDGSVDTRGTTSSFHPIKDLANVNKRRAAVGLEPIEEVAKRKGIEL